MPKIQGKLIRGAWTSNSGKGWFWIISCSIQGIVLNNLNRDEFFYKHFNKFKQAGLVKHDTTNATYNNIQRLLIKDSIKKQREVNLFFNYKNNSKKNCCWAYFYSKI